MRKGDTNLIMNKVRFLIHNLTHLREHFRIGPCKKGSLFTTRQNIHIGLDLAASLVQVLFDGVKESQQGGNLSHPQSDDTHWYNPIAPNFFEYLAYKH
jgi:hypothetical protein